MKLYVLIGGIGSGKTTVQRMLQEQGAVCLDLDDVGHQVLNQDEIHSALVDAFGQDVLDAQGAIDRRALAAHAFVSHDSTCLLESIVQPAILARVQRTLAYLEGAGVPVVVVEISAYRGPGGIFDELMKRATGVIDVAAPVDVRLQRAVSQGFDEQDARNRLQRQASDEQRAAWADWHLDNGSTTEDLREQVKTLWERIMQAGGDESVFQGEA